MGLNPCEDAEHIRSRHRLHQRACVVAACLALAGLSVAQEASAQQGFPSRAIQIVNPYQDGSTTDLLARALAPGMQRRLGQEVTVVNRPGAGGAQGASEVARAIPDGHHLLFAPALVVSVLPAARGIVRYTPQSLVPVCQTFVNAMAIVVRADAPYATLADLVQEARSRPGALTFGHPGAATIPHLAMEELLDVAGIEMSAVSHNGDPAAIERLLARRLDAAAVVLASASREGVRVLGVFADERHNAFPGVPTVKEQGFDISATSFGGLMAPAATPPQIVSRLAGVCELAARDETYATAAQRAAQPPGYYANVATFRHRLQRDIEIKRRLLTRLGAMQ